MSENNIPILNRFSKITNLPGVIRLSNDLSKANSVYFEAKADKTLDIGNESLVYLNISNGKISGITAVNNDTDAANKKYIDDIKTALETKISEKDKYDYWTIKKDTDSFNISSKGLINLKNDSYVLSSISSVEGGIDLSLSHKIFSAPANIGPTSSETLSYGESFEVPYLSVENGHISAGGVKTFTLPEEKELSLSYNETSGNIVNITPYNSTKGVYNLINLISVDDHKVTFGTTEVTLPDISVDNSTNSTTTTISDTFDVITAVEKDNSAKNNINVTKSKFKIPTLSNATGNDTTRTLKFGDTIDVVTGVSGSGHTITKDIASYTLPTLAINADTNKIAAQNPSHGASFDIVSGVTYDSETSKISYSTSKVTLPAETKVSVNTTSSDPKSLSHGETFTVLVEASDNDDHQVNLVSKTFTLPTVEDVTIPDLSLGDASLSTRNLNEITSENGVKFEALTGISVSEHKITPIKTEYTIPQFKETELTIETPTEHTVTIPEDGTFEALDQIEGALHTIESRKGNFKIDIKTVSETVEDDDGNEIPATEIKPINPLDGGTVDVVGDFDSSGIKITKSIASLRFNPLNLAGGSREIINSDSLSHGGKINVISGISLSNKGALTVETQELTLPPAPIITDKLVKQNILEAEEDGSAKSKPILLANSEVAENAEAYFNTNVYVDSNSGLTAKNLTATDTLRTKNAVITGDLIVAGSTISENKVNITTSDYAIELAKGRTGTGSPLTQLAGFFVSNYDGNSNNGGIFYDANGSARVGDVYLSKAENSDEYEIEDNGTQPILTRKEADELTNKGILAWDSSNKRAYTRTLVAGEDYEVPETSETTLIEGAKINITDNGTDGNHNYKVEHETISVSKPTPAENNSLKFVYVSDVVTDAYGHTTEIAREEKTITIPSIPSIGFSNNEITESGGSLVHGGNLKVLTGYTASGHTLTPKTTTYTLPTESPITFTNPTLDETNDHGKSFSIISGASASGHHITFSTKTIEFPELKTKDKTGEEQTLSITTPVEVVTGVSINPLDPDKLDIEKGEILLSIPDVEITNAATAPGSSLSHGDTFTAITGLQKSGHGIKPTVTTYTLPEASKVSLGTINSSGIVSYSGTQTDSLDVLVPDVVVADNNVLTFKKKTISFEPHNVSISDKEIPTSTTEIINLGGTTKLVYGIDASGTEIAWNSKTIQLPTAAAVYSAIKSSITNDFVDKTTAQTVSGQKTFSKQILANAGIKTATVNADSTLNINSGTTTTLNSTGLTVNSKASFVSNNKTTNIESGVLSTEEIRAEKISYTNSNAVKAYTKYNANTNSIDFIFA